MRSSSTPPFGSPTLPRPDAGSNRDARAVVLPCACLFVAMLNLTLVVAGLKELVMDELGGTVTDAALFFTLEMAAYVLAAPLAGLASDRSGRRRPFIVGGFLAAGLLYLALAQVESIPALLVLRFLQGAAAVTGWSTTMALALDGARDENRGRLAGWLGASLILGVGLGAPIGGYVARAGGPRAPLFAAGWLFIVLAVAALALAEPAQRRVRVALRTILGALTARPKLLAPWGFYALERLTVGLFVVVFPLYLAALGADNPVVRGRYLSAFLLPFAFLQVFAGRLIDRFGPLPPLLAGAAAYGLLMMTVGATSLSGLWGLMIGLGATAAVMFPPTLAWTSALAPPEARAMAIAGLNLAGSIGFAIGPLLGAWIASLAGFPAAFATAGALELAAVAAALLVLRRRRARLSGSG